MRPSATIRQVSYLDILGDSNAQELLKAYAAECSIPDAEPQTQIYAAMEQAGMLQCFGAYVADDLVGLVAVLASVMPHHGKRIATIESLYVAPSHRGDTSNALLDAAEACASESGCVALTYTARRGSAYEMVLSRRSGCQRSHAMFTRWL